MMDPLTVIGLAGNIAQFIDFACKLFSVSRSIYASNSGLSNEGEDLRTLTTNLQSISAKLKLVPLQSLQFTISNELQGLALRCDNIATELLIVLEKLALKDKHSKWDSFHAALKMIWNKGKIDEMSKRLDSYRLQLVLELTKLERDDNRKALISWFAELRAENNMLQAKNSQSIKHLKDNILSALGSLTAEIKNIDKEQKSYSLSKHGAMVSELAERGSLLAETTEVLRSLHFPGMKSRQARIADAHQETYQWAFEAHFKRWMTSSDFLFWVSGKPGSGKSTLMKHVLNNPQTLRLLKEWYPCAPLETKLEISPACRLIFASYFFWINGDNTQRSQEGLLRSILFDILSKYPEPIAVLKPFQNDDSGLKAATIWNWTFENCLDLFETILRQTHGINKYCLFIDGLDEYEGDKAKLINFIKNCQKFPNLKICVACRPWNIFEAAFGQSDTNKVYMQDLNAGDIRKYVSDHFEEHPLFQMFKSDNEEVHQLAHEIIEKANGVFLWVYLVVRSLVEGLENADRILDLKRRLHAFPSDLNEYFQHILNSLDPIYKVQVVRGFEAALAASLPLSLVHFWYLDREEEDGLEYALRMPMQSLPHSKVVQRSEARAKIMIKRINGRFKGLLEVTREASTDTDGTLFRLGPVVTNLIDNRCKVDFLHRTVRDFLYTSDCRQVFSSWTPPAFKVNYSLSLAYLADLKELLAGEWLGRYHSRVTDLVADILHNLLEYESRTGKIPGSLYLELNRILNIPVNEETVYTRLPWEEARTVILESDKPSFLHWVISHDALGLIKTVYPRFAVSLTIGKKWSYMKTAIESGAHLLIEYIALARPPLKLSPAEVSSLISNQNYEPGQKPDLLSILRILGRCDSVCKGKLSDEDICILIKNNVSPELMDELFEHSSIPDDYSLRYMLSVTKGRKSSWDTQFEEEDRETEDGY